MQTKESDLEKWLRKRKMTTNHFTELVGCSRPTIWKVKRQIAISPRWAAQIAKLTHQEVKPLISAVGRRPEY